jgi:hypothetical protein
MQENLQGKTADEVNSDNEQILAYADDIIARLVKMCQYDANLEIRLLALKCLNSMAINVTPNKLIKYQRFVCKQLEQCLKDRKRVCRQLAVQVRNRWFLLTTKNIDGSDH